MKHLLQNHLANFKWTWHKPSLGEGDLGLFKWRDCSSPRGDNSKRVKIHWNFLKIFFSRTSRPKSIKLGTNYSWVKRIQVCSNKGRDPLQRGDNHKNVKMRWVRLKIFLRTMKPQAKIYMKIFWYSTKSSLLKSWLMGVGWGHDRGNFFLHVLIKGTIKGTYLKDLLNKNQWAHRQIELKFT
jgi:hypothetical protein